MEEVKNKKVFDLLEKSIVRVFNYETNEELKYNDIQFKFVESINNKNFKKYDLKCFIDGEILKYPRKYSIVWKCRCGSVNTMRYQKFLEKMIKTNVFCCCHCSQDKSYGEYYRANSKNIIKHNDMIYNENRKESYVYNFDNESEEFKTNYSKRNTVLSKEEFNSLYSNCYSINNILREDLNKHQIKFIYASPCLNGLKYTNMIEIDRKLEKLDIKIKCCLCDKIIKPHIANLKKNIETIKLEKYRCTQCSFCNTHNSIRLYEPLNISYQSKIELDFIKECEKRNIRITRGPKIKYVFNNKECTYFCDFELPDYNRIIEIKENHIYYKKQIESGKQLAKEKYANEYAKNNGSTFELLFPRNYEDFFKSINERDSLNTNEN